MTNESTALESREAERDEGQPQQTLSMKSLDHRLCAIEQALQDTQRMLVYHAEYSLSNEGRDRHAGPKPHDRLRELRRQSDELRKAIANGFTTNDRPDTDGAG